jgi:uncharacterized protein
MLHASTRLCAIDPEVGVGVVATRVIPAGTITWALDALDRVLTDADTRALPDVFAPALDHYTFVIGERRVLCWDDAKYMNHSCAPTCLGTPYGFEIAVRDILPGEELTTDYAVLMHEGDRPFPCRCSAERCRGEVIADTGATWWRHAHAAALRRLGEVTQPLLPHVESGAVARALADAGIV